MNSGLLIIDEVNLHDVAHLRIGSVLLLHLTLKLVEILLRSSLTTLIAKFDIF